MVGSAGSDEKCKWLKESLGFDEVFNYKTKTLEGALNDHAPNGLDCFFDNVSICTLISLFYKIFL